MPQRLCLFFILCGGLLAACNNAKATLTTGEYSNSLILATNPDGDFYAYSTFTPSDDTITEPEQLFITGTPYASGKGNVTAFRLPRHDSALLFGTWERLGKDSFAITLDGIPDSHFFPAHRVYALHRNRPEWLRFYICYAEKNTYLYTRPDSAATRRLISPASLLRSIGSRGHWAQVQLDSVEGWVMKNEVY